MSRKEALAVMLKAPVPGKVKTRLIPPLTEDEAAGLYRAFLIDIFNRITLLKDIDIHAFYAPMGKEGKIINIIPEGITLNPQKGRDLGERIYNIFDYLLKIKGYGRAAVIGTDSPDLPLEYIKKAFRELEGLEGGGGLVVGPTKDGGYYLISMDRLTRVPFEGISWSTEKVLDQTLKKARENGLPVRLLEPWYDVDTVGDLSLVRDNGQAPETCGYIKKMRLISRVRTLR
jgi:rSAM/selenodomain-associated transferase 1